MKTNLYYVPHSLSFVNISLELHTIMVGACGEIFIFGTYMPLKLSCQHDGELKLSTPGMFASVISKDFP